MPANLTTNNISTTYQGLLHFDAALPTTGFWTVYDGVGNPTGLQLSRTNIKTVDMFVSAVYTPEIGGAGTGDWASAHVWNQLNGGSHGLHLNYTRSNYTYQDTGCTIYDGKKQWIAQFHPGSRAMVVAGDIVAFYTSDKALKDNIKKIDKPLEKITKLNGVTFEWNDKQCTHTGKDVGVIAQDVEQVIPEAVTTRENGYKAVKYEKIIPLLIESIKELIDKNEALEAKLAAITQ
jgi:hypothetical protein